MYSDQNIEQEENAPKKSVTQGTSNMFRIAVSKKRGDQA